MTGQGVAEGASRVCTSCGTENRPLARFCNSCGAGLEAPIAPREERKLVSILFVDLVGFTARSDQADPEDVRDALQLYHASAKKADRAARRSAREVHRRRGDGGVRRARRAR